MEISKFLNVILIKAYQMRELFQKSITEKFNFEKADTKSFKMFLKSKADNRNIQTSKADNR